jgi:hypothetical protein
MNLCSSLVLLLVVLLLCSPAARSETIDFNRVHLVDAVVPSGAAVASRFLFRGNAPLMINTDNEVTFAYDLVMNYTRIRAMQANETAAGFPPKNDNIYLVDITFENVFDKYFENEAHFWSNASNAAKGRYLQWELLGAVEWATGMSTSEQNALIQDGTVWREDQVPIRIQRVRQMLLDGPPAGYDALVVYVHCAGGCDRTGEFVGAYRVNFFHTLQLKPIYELDVEECGRAPDYYASGALGWFCLTWNLYNASALKLPPMPDCLTAYTCDLFGPCNATTG